jgi:RNA recognition motif-containing protein
MKFIILLNVFITNPCSIVEYATREQAQNAIQTLSNQSLMGRLVYVREVSSSRTEKKSQITDRKRIRTARPSLDSPDLPPAATSVAAVAAAALVVVAATVALATTAVVPWVVVANVSSTSPTFVNPSYCSLTATRPEC